MCNLFLLMAVSQEIKPIKNDPVFDGLLKKKLWVIHTRENSKFKSQNAKHVFQSMKDHMAYQQKIESEGVLFAAGPYSDEHGKPIGGMIVIRAASKEEARRIADADPMHANNLRTYTLNQWMVNEGQISLKINFSTGTYEFD
jgi:uncharacterized protein YciI